MKSLPTSVSEVLRFYYGYAEYIRAIVNNEQPKKLGYAHYLSIWCNYGHRPKAQAKLLEITKRHFPKLFVVSKWKTVALELLGINPKDYAPSLKSLACSIQNESKEKQELFFRDLYAAV